MAQNFKRKNRGLITFGIVALSAVAITATGFAAWVISGTDSKDVSGNIQVDTVENSNHTITLGDMTNNNIYFGGTKNGNLCTWLSNPGEEKLSFSVTVTVANVNSDPGTTENILEASAISVVNGSGDDATATYNGIADKESADGLVGALPTPTITAETGAYNSTAHTYTATLSATFTWGRQFGGQNPLNYYYDKNEAKDKAEANTRLTQLHDALNGLSYKVTVTSK